MQPAKCVEVGGTLCFLLASCPLAVPVSITPQSFSTLKQEAFLLQQLKSVCSFPNSCRASLMAPSSMPHYLQASATTIQILAKLQGGFAHCSLYLVLRSYLGSCSWCIGPTGYNLMEEER